jgi:hypothetical protein
MRSAPTNLIVKILGCYGAYQRFTGKVTIDPKS